MKQGRPRLEQNRKKAYRISVRLNRDIYESLIKECLEKHTTINEYVRELLSDKRSEDRIMTG